VSQAHSADLPSARKQAGWSHRRGLRSTCATALIGAALLAGWAGLASLRGTGELAWGVGAHRTPGGADFHGVQQRSVMRDGR